jgi:hypothetical protein
MEASNNKLDPAASNFLVQKCQEHCVRLLAISRAVADEFHLPRSVIDAILRDSGENSFGQRVAEMQKQGVQDLWERVNATGEARKLLPERCDVKWFQDTFCHGDKVGDSVWESVKGFKVYTPLALLVSVPRISDQSFEFQKHTVRGIDHRIITKGHNESNYSAIMAIVQNAVKLILKGILMNVSDFSTKREIKVEGMVTFNVSDAMPNWLETWHDKRRRDSHMDEESLLARVLQRTATNDGRPPRVLDAEANDDETDDESDFDGSPSPLHHMQPHSAPGGGRGARRLRERAESGDSGNSAPLRQSETNPFSRKSLSAIGGSRSPAKHLVKRNTLPPGELSVDEVHRIRKANTSPSNDELMND